MKKQTYGQLWDTCVAEAFPRLQQADARLVYPGQEWGNEKSWQRIFDKLFVPAGVAQWDVAIELIGNRFSGLRGVGPEFEAGSGDGGDGGEAIRAGRGKVRRGAGAAADGADASDPGACGARGVSFGGRQDLRRAGRRGVSGVYRDGMDSPAGGRTFVAAACFARQRAGVRDRGGAVRGADRDGGGFGGL